MVWLIAFLFIGFLFWCLIYEYQRNQARTTKEYEAELEKRGITGQMMQTGFLELQRMLSPETKAAVEFAKDEKQGTTRTAKEDQDP